MKILCLIPARSGSKGLLDKNIKIMIDKPLLAWSIDQAKNTEYYKEGKMRIVVSTDSEKYRKIALKWGAEVPFLRPKNISQDSSTDLDFIKHSITFFKNNENYRPDIILQLRPTQPCRSNNLIDDCLNKFLQSTFDSLRTVIPFNKLPFKMYTTTDDILVPIFKKVEGINHNEPYNLGRQYFPKVYLHNGYVDIIRTTVIENNKLSGNTMAYVMKIEDNIDIDNECDWEKAEKYHIFFSK